MDGKELGAIIVIILIGFGGLFAAMIYSDYSRTECVKAMANHPITEIQLVCGVKK